MSKINRQLQALTDIVEELLQLIPHKANCWIHRDKPCSCGLAQLHQKMETERLIEESSAYDED